jgi:Coenzyme PQQ synthesis protein D (PqqD)
MPASAKRPTLTSVVAVNATGTYFGLDQVGARIWTLIAERAGLGVVFQPLLTEYEVAPAGLERDLLALVDGSDHRTPHATRGVRRAPPSLEHLAAA